jgi:hypothetical protein
MLISLADKQYVEDSVFWNDYVFKYFTETPQKEAREFTADEAKKLWDALIYVKLKCPTLDVKEPLSVVEAILD